MSKKHITAVIPARYGSTRLPAKMLLELDGKSILQRTFEQTVQAKLIDEVVIATDDQRIFDHAASFGAKVEMTDPNHQSGTDRIAELAQKNINWEIIVNVQGDEPFIQGADIDKAIEPFMHDPLIEMSSLYHYVRDWDEIQNPSVVKVVTDINDYALYFSRSPIPYLRDQNKPCLFKKHMGLYAYRRNTLLAISKLPIHELEESEKLEQLRALANQIKIKMIETATTSFGIDTEKDYQRAIAHSLEFGRL